PLSLRTGIFQLPASTPATTPDRTGSSAGTGSREQESALGNRCRSRIIAASCKSTDFPMKEHVSTLIQQALEILRSNGVLPADIHLPIIQVDITKDKNHGDFASTIAMVLAKTARKNPRELATHLGSAL